MDSFKKTKNPFSKSIFRSRVVLILIVPKKPSPRRSVLFVWPSFLTRYRGHGFFNSGRGILFHSYVFNLFLTWTLAAVRTIGEVSERREIESFRFEDKNK